MKRKYNTRILDNAKNQSSRRKTAIILIAIIVGCVCIIVSSFFSMPWDKYDNWRTLINVVLSTIATVSFASVAWEGIAKYAFSQDVVEMVGLSNRIKQSGIFAIEESFSDIEWRDLLVHANHITAIFTYSIRWGKDNSELIKTAVNNGCDFIVVLPDTKSPGIMEALTFRFSGVDNIEGKIHEAEVYYKDLGAEIKYYPKTIQNSFYLIDDTGIIAPFNHQKAVGGHAPSVPAILARKPGFMFDYINDEVSAIIASSTAPDCN